MILRKRLGGTNIYYEYAKVLKMESRIVGNDAIAIELSIRYDFVQFELYIGTAAVYR
jgi:hypothetical protein